MNGLAICDIGEDETILSGSVLWPPRRRFLWFVDINKKWLHCTNRKKRKIEIRRSCCVVTGIYFWVSVPSESICDFLNRNTKFRKSTMFWHRLAILECLYSFDSFFGGFPGFIMKFWILNIFYIVFVYFWDHFQLPCMGQYETINKKLSRVESIVPKNILWECFNA